MVVSKYQSKVYANPVNVEKSGVSVLGAVRDKKRVAFQQPFYINWFDADRQACCDTATIVATVQPYCGLNPIRPDPSDRFLFNNTVLLQFP
jgi:hypothetical protein